jgi:hypothetical protein
MPTFAQGIPSFDLRIAAHGSGSGTRTERASPFASGIAPKGSGIAPLS